MALTSMDTATLDHLFLRTDTEHDQGVLPAHLEHETGTDQDRWPMPAEGEAIVQRMRLCERLAVLALQIDPPAAANPSDALRASLAASLQQATQTHGAEWFAWRHDRYGCLLPDLDAAAAQILAHRLQTDLAEKMIETVSVGIAEYPMLEFDRRQSLINALKALDHAAFFGPNSCVAFDSVSLNISGDHYYQLHDLQSAMREYQYALRLDENNITARNSLGVCLAESGNTAAARIEFETVRTHASNDAMALFNIGLLHLLDNDPLQALDYFLQADQAASQTIEIVFQIGKLLTEQHRWPQAMPYLESARSLRPEWGAIYSLQGQCLESQGQVSEAIEAYKRAVKLSPNDGAALAGLGTLYADKGENMEICLAFCRQSVLIAPFNALFHYRLAKLLHRDRQWEAALTEYEQAAALGQAVDEPISEVRAQLQGLASDSAPSPVELV